MTESTPPLEVERCPSCHGTFAIPRACCPRCGQRPLVRGEIPADGVVLAATELSTPPKGRSAPHPLILVELAEGMRVLATRPGPIPAVGAPVLVVRDGPGFTLR